MHFTQVLISLSVLIACGSVGHGDITAHQQPSTATEESEQCSTCEFRQHSKLMRLHGHTSPALHKLSHKMALRILPTGLKKLKNCSYEGVLNK
uniref:Secreted protein n=1 Tax=Cyprinus carpio TaxID=7962 RepID=A0A8C1JJM7_CYPCA